MLSVILGVLVLPARDIPPDDARLQFSGVLHKVPVKEGIELLRFSEKTLSPKNRGGTFQIQRARQTSGCVIRFRTRSVSVKLKFVPLAAVREYQFAVYQDGKLAKVFEENPNQRAFTLEVASAAPGRSVLYEVALPSWANAAFAGLVLEGESDLEALPPDQRPVYAAVGDSISHGTGQMSRSDLTFPWHLAKACGWQLMNFGIGGSVTSPGLVPDIASAKPDVVTILWGYNDWQGGKSRLEPFVRRYREALEGMRKHCPDAEIYCITPIVTATAPVPNGLDLDAFRQAVDSLVRERRNAGDLRVFVVRGEELTSSGDLCDGIHLSPEGAARFAHALQMALPSRWPGGAAGKSPGPESLSGD